MKIKKIQLEYIFNFMALLSMTGSAYCLLWAVYPSMKYGQPLMTTIIFNIQWWLGFVFGLIFTATFTTLSQHTEIIPEISISLPSIRRQKKQQKEPEKERKEQGKPIY